ncbi:hypothetical protein ABT096_38330, partial [Streptomyces sp. NPDC002561]|uniref:hypothetical protein n=1 Tax=Streptomyces sp. NPDC002561 TaxID=3154418 RepID=UPI003330780B
MPSRVTPNAAAHIRLFGPLEPLGPLGLLEPPGPSGLSAALWISSGPQDLTPDQAPALASPALAVACPACG